MSKGCKTYAVDLSAYFDGELEGEAAERMKTHLGGCDGCREALDRLGKLRSALHSLARPSQPGRSILSDLKARMAEEGRKERRQDGQLVS